MLLSDMGAKDPTDPVLQLGSGCLVDQLVGQFIAHVYGLGYLVDPGNVQQTLRSIMKYNFMLYEGQLDTGLRCIQVIRDRYDGRKRSPFNEAECGHHYARAMASWAAILALTGFQYSGVEQSMTFACADKVAQTIWSNGYAWGIFRQKPGADGIEVELKVLGGDLTLRQFTLAGYGSISFGAPQRIMSGQHWTHLIQPN